MRISVTPEFPTGQTPMFIALGVSPSGTELTAPKEFEVEHEFNEQVVELLRANEIQVYDRGNHRTMITFKVSNYADSQMGNGGATMFGRAASDMLLASRFCVKGLIKIEGFFEGNIGSTLYMRGVVKCTAKHLAAMSYELAFKILGGKFSTNPPPAVQLS